MIEFTEFIKFEYSKTDSLAIPVPVCLLFLMAMPVIGVIFGFWGIVMADITAIGLILESCE